MEKNLTFSFLITLFLVFPSGALHSSSTKNYTDPITGMEFVYIQSGCYQMGDHFGDGYDDEKPVHEVCLNDFYIGKYEVTWGEYEKIVGPYLSHIKKGDDYPVAKVSWYDAQSYIYVLNNKTSKGFRLPTEAEWEYAARSMGKKEKYPGSDSPKEVAWYYDNSEDRTHPVGEKSANSLGLYDMSGNVREWCQDWYYSGYYDSSPRDNPTSYTTGSRRVLRGGGIHRKAEHVRLSYRDGKKPVASTNCIGFRLVFSIEQ